MFYSLIIKIGTDKNKNNVQEKDFNYNGSMVKHYNSWKNSNFKRKFIN